MKKILLLLLAVLAIIVPAEDVFGFEAREVWRLYHSSEEVYQILTDMAEKHSDVMSYEVIGKSIQGKDILLFKVGNPNGGAFMFDGRIHGAEDCGTEHGIEFLRWVLESDDPDAKRVLRNNHLLFIPLINIDTEYRPNMRRQYVLPDKSTVDVKYGVDLNRNFVTGFGSSGSGNPDNSYSYRGLSAASEPETRAVRNAMQKYLKNDGKSIYLNVHCGLQMLRYYSYTDTTKKVVNGITSISAERGGRTNSYYPSRQMRIGGFVMSDAAAFSGGNGWLLEVTSWDKMPMKLDDYLATWHPRVFPIYLSMAQSVERQTQEPCVSSWQCDAWSDCVSGVQTRTCVDTARCARDMSEQRQCSSDEMAGAWDFSSGYSDRINGNTAVAYGSPRFVSDPTYGTALRLDDDDLVMITYTDNALAPKEGFTVDVNVKFSSTRHSHIVRDKRSYLLQRVHVDEAISRFQGGIYTNNEWRPLLSSGTDIDTNRWYRVTYTYDSDLGLFRLYIDKELDIQQYWYGKVDVSSSSEIYIGNREELDRILDGNIRDLRIYDRALSHEEVAALN